MNLLQKKIPRNYVAINCIDCENTNCFIKKCSPEWLDYAGSFNDKIIANPGQVIFEENSVVRGMYFIQFGKIKVHTSGINGRQQIVRLATNGHILGHRGFGGERYPVGASAFEHSVICFMNNQQLFLLFMNNPAFTYSLMMYYSEELRKIERRIKYMSQMKVREKLIEAILYLYSVFGLRNDRTLDVGISIKEIASLAAVTPQQAAKYLTELKDERFIERAGKKIRLNNLDKMKEVLKEFY